MLVSLRRDSGDPVLEAITDKTYALLEEMRADFQECTGAPFDGGSGVLFANDVMIAIHGHAASWELFDVADFEAWILANEPGFARVFETILADLLVFTSFLWRTHRMPPDRAAATEARFRRTSLGEAVYAAAGVAPAEPSIFAPRNRAERRAAQHARRRAN